MALSVPGVGEVKLLNYFVNKGAAPENLRLKLFTNNIGTISQALTAASFTEAAGNGYAFIDLVAANWTITQGDPSDATCLPGGIPAQFNFTGALGLVYGYYVIGGTDTVLRWAEIFADGPYNVVNTGDAIKVTLRITAQ